MGAIPKNILREIIKENDFKIYAYFKDAFKDLLQEMLEAEMDVTLGYDKNKQTDNYRNGHSQKTVKSQYGEVDLSIPRDRKGDFEPKTVPTLQN